MRTRALGASLVKGGGVRMNRGKVTKPGHSVVVGDVLTVAVHAHIRVLRITGLAQRRGPASAAQTLYEDLAMSNSDGSLSQKRDASGPESC